METQNRSLLSDALWDDIDETLLFPSLFALTGSFTGFSHLSPFHGMIELLRHAREAEKTEEAQHYFNEALRPIFESDKEALARETPAPNLRRTSQTEEAEYYVEDVIALTNSVFETCDNLASRGVDVRAAREKAMEFGLTAFPISVLNPHVPPKERLRLAHFMGMNKPVLRGLSGTIGRRLKLFISEPHGPQETLSLAAQHRGQEPVFLVGAHRGTMNYFHPLIENAPSFQHFADGTSFDKKFFEKVQEATVNPQPLPPLREALAARHTALNAQRLEAAPR